MYMTADNSWHGTGNAVEITVLHYLYGYNRFTCCCATNFDTLTFSGMCSICYFTDQSKYLLTVLFNKLPDMLAEVCWFHVRS